ncbi:dTDP-4-dehydrorhamnose 3,5-epimerase [Fulvivirga sediminis]|uniref:dTDP-4-dehydrorhamnose 3,5-epimerase n=1 Tax=Fulvivirga sediminis TaxID=2803949 RepID=A0A937F7W2_9BACT|nr:dTDP-4-dehydrorhamnose 3,5-epimerase [Fulvivirga sediminis]MBL3656234.1 dTDP-4-dehydrorhamnose 3,5-epimerase [Fulvivirga sediminis]
MTIKETGISGLYEIHPSIFNDDRGFFFESYNEKKLSESGINYNFVQDNQSFSKKNVIRGLHLQHAPYAQAKLVRVVTGKVLDVVVDLRPDSKTYKQVYYCLLESDKNNALMVPDGFAHGFAALEDSIFSYKCSNLYHKESESGIIYNDTDLNIDWQVSTPIVSDKDLELPTLAEFEKAVLN